MPCCHRRCHELKSSAKIRGLSGARFSSVRRFMQQGRAFCSSFPIHHCSVIDHEQACCTSQERCLCPKGGAKDVRPCFSPPSKLASLDQRGIITRAPWALTVLSACRVKCLRDIINNKEGPLLQALDRMKAVCTDCGALQQWNAYEDCMLACLYNRADAYDQKQNIEFPTSSQKGALSITPRFEQREVTKSLIREIGDLEKAIIAKGKYETTWHNAALSVLVRQGSTLNE